MKGAYKSTWAAYTGQKANLITTTDVVKRGCISALFAGVRKVE